MPSHAISVSGLSKVYGRRSSQTTALKNLSLSVERGTIFGLQTGGRTESILMSLPPNVRFRYNWAPPAGTPEAKLYTDFIKPRDWLGLSA